MRDLTSQSLIDGHGLPRLDVYGAAVVDARLRVGQGEAMGATFQANFKERCDAIGLTVNIDLGPGIGVEA